MSTRRKAGIVGGVVAIVLVALVAVGGAHVALQQPLEASSAEGLPIGSRNTGIGDGGVPQFQVPLGIPRSVQVALPFGILYSTPPGDCPPA